jgi:adenylate cyclase
VEPQTQRTSIDLIASVLEPLIPDLGRLSSPDGAVTLMLSDIADAPIAAERLGPERWEQLLAEHSALIEQVVSRHDGELLKSERDGFLASFNSAHGGLHAAIELQKALTGPGEGASDAVDGGDAPDAGEAPDAGDHAVAVRIGLHSGFVIANPDQLLGRNVVLASRIAAQAKGGEILVSSALKQYTEKDPSFQFEPHGEYHFKGVVGEHVVYLVRWR